MSILTKNVLKTSFQTGDVPTGSDFENLIESAYNLADDAHKLGAKPYEPARSYAENDTCLYSPNNTDYNLYRANKTTTGTFVEADWNVVGEGNGIPLSGTDALNGNIINPNNGDFYIGNPNAYLEYAADGSGNYYQTILSASNNKGASIIITAAEETQGFIQLLALDTVGEGTRNIQITRGGDIALQFNDGSATGHVVIQGTTARYSTSLPLDNDLDLTHKSWVLAQLTEAVGGATSIDDANTAADKTWSSQKINTSISTAISNILNSSPTALDTLKELADALGNDPNFATTVTTSLSQKVAISDVTNLLTSTETAKPLSAAQGKALKDLIDALTTTTGTKAATSYVDTQDKKLQFKLSFYGSRLIRDFWQDAGSITSIHFGSDVTKLEVSINAGTSYTDLTVGANLPYAIAAGAKLLWRVTFAGTGNAGAVQVKGTYTNNI